MSVTYSSIAVPRGELGEVPVRADGGFYPLSMRLRGRLVLADTFADLVAYMLRRPDYPHLPEPQRRALLLELGADRRRSVQKTINEEMAEAFAACTPTEQVILRSEAPPLGIATWAAPCPLVIVAGSYPDASPSGQHDNERPDASTHAPALSPAPALASRPPEDRGGVDQAIQTIETTTDAAFIRSLQSLGVLDLGFVPTREGDALRDER